MQITTSSTGSFQNAAINDRGMTEHHVLIMFIFIDNVAYPVTRRRTSALALLSPREMQVAAMVRGGFSSKEMADKLCVTKKVIDAHRSHIRSKLGLARDENLQTWLEMNL